MDLYVTMSYVLSAFQLSVTRCVFSLNWLERVLFLGLCLSWSCALLSMAAIYSLGHRVRWVPAVSGLGRDALQGTRARGALIALCPYAHPGAIPDGLSLPMVFTGPFGGRKKKGARSKPPDRPRRRCRVKRGCPHAARGVLSGRLLPKSEPRARAGVLLPKPPAPWLASMCFLACLTVLCCPSASGAGGAQWDRRVRSEPDPDSCRRSTFSALLSGTRRGAAPRDSSPPAPPPGMASPPLLPLQMPALSPSRRLGVFLRFPPEQPPTRCVPTLSGAPHLLPHLFVYICVDL